MLFALAANFSHAQGSDTLKPTVKYKKVFPGLVLGWNRVGFSTGEAGLLIGLTNNSLKQTKLMSVFLHGPSLGCELGNYQEAFRAAPKLSYEIYTLYLGGKISVIDYMNDNIHSLYISPEAGITLASMLNIFAGANFPVSGEEVEDVKTFRMTVSINLLFFYFGKDKSKKITQ